MSKYQRPQEFKNRIIHPIWRGIGCVMGLILPIISYFLAVEFVKYGISNRWPIPSDLLGYLHIPEQIWVIKLPLNFLRPITSYPNILAVAVFSIVILILLSGLISWIYSLLYRAVGPPPLTPVDAPPVKGRKVRKSR